MTHLRTARYHLGIHIWVLLVAVGFFFWGKFRQRHDLLFLTVSQRHDSRLGANYCLIEVKALLLFVIISAIPVPKIYKVLSGKRSTLLPLARNNAQTLEGSTTSSKLSRTLRASISFFSESDWQLVYGEKTVESSSALRINEVGISPPLESALGCQHGGQQTQLDIKETMKISEQTQAKREERVMEERNGSEKGLMRQHQLTLSQTCDEPQQKIETNTDDTQINFGWQEPGLTKEQRGDEPLQRHTQEGNEKAEDRTEKCGSEAWCCGCGGIEIFSQGICDNCKSSLCASCIRTD